MKVVFVGEPSKKALARVYGILDRLEDAENEQAIVGGTGATATAPETEVR